MKQTIVRKAFTVIEMIAVLGVIAVITSLGVFGVLAFQDAVELDNAYTKVNSYMTTVQNYALNKAVYPFNTTTFDTVSDDAPEPNYLYGIYFTNNEMYLTGCQKDTMNQRSCAIVETQTIQSGNSTFSGSCNYIGFVSGTIDIDILDAVDVQGSSITTQTEPVQEACTLTILHETGPSKTIQINPIQNTID